MCVHVGRRMGRGGGGICPPAVAPQLCPEAAVHGISNPAASCGWCWLCSSVAAVVAGVAAPHLSKHLRAACPLPLTGCRTMRFTYQSARSSHLPVLLIVGCSSRTCMLNFCSCVPVYVPCMISTPTDVCHLPGICRAVRPFKPWLQMLWSMVAVLRSAHPTRKELATNVMRTVRARVWGSGRRELVGGGGSGWSERLLGVVGGVRTCSSAEGVARRA